MMSNQGSAWNIRARQRFLTGFSKDMLFGCSVSRFAREVCKGLSARMASASAQEEIDEPTGKFFRARNEIAYLELLA
jgi:hypothetical protein